MIKLISIIFIIIFIAQIAKGTPAENPRIKFTINESWKFYPGDISDAENISFDDSNWQQVRLPHTWNSEDVLSKSQSYRRGTGWYRRNLVLNDKLKDDSSQKKFFLFFEGANQVADVFVNGKYAGKHVGGYTAFVFDITDLLSFDHTNIIAVKVNNSHNPDIPPLNADFNFYGGIYRDVWLLITDPVHVDVLDNASPGIYISTPFVSEDSALIKIIGKVVNETGTEKNLKVINKILNHSFNEAALSATEIIISANSFSQFNETILINKPNLWSPDEPYLYKVQTEVYVNNELRDIVINTLGIRWFEMLPDKGLYLNGKPVKLYGANRHQDFHGLGSALHDDLHIKDIEIIKNQGFNFLRLAHYPQDPSVLEAADKVGLIIWEEIPVINIITMSESFYKNSEQMMVEMIRQHYNHPSVFIWGLMNEVMLIKPKPVPEGYIEAINILASRLNELSHSEDPARFTAAALSNGEVDDGTGFEKIPDIVGMNLYFGWYYDKPSTLGEFLDNYHSKYPDHQILISEYGAGSDQRIHTFFPKPFDFSTEYINIFHEESFRIIKERDYLLGSGIWSMFDFGSQFRQDSKPALNQKGIYYSDRLPKDISFFYKANLLNEQVIHIAAGDWQTRGGSSEKDKIQPVKVYSNLSRGELLINDSTLGIKEFDNYSAVWDVPFKPDNNIVKVRSVSGSSKVEDIVEIKYHDASDIFNKSGSSPAYIAVNAGSHYQYIDSYGTFYLADKKYSKGSWGYIGGEEFKTQHKILNTDDDPLFQASLAKADSYRFDLPDGIYEIILFFVEPEHENQGERIFSVYVNNTPFIVNMDMVSDVGRYHPVERKIILNVLNNEGLRINLTPHKGDTIISGIKIIRKL